MDDDESVVIDFRKYQSSSYQSKASIDHFNMLLHNRDSIGENYLTDETDDNDGRRHLNSTDYASNISKGICLNNTSVFDDAKYFAYKGNSPIKMKSPNRRHT
mmetsp:Transcript_37369/g.35956  ORF Transcript_37369/g.35956 Transcript_37369/m.35956 type:complete len:102 (+) Transcript_37369:539-844(+)|eukprot:CAMPEP_0170550382 /NCGR_PEP_ID=MMETSP0211-20121228/8450_1 /TAXON_ID=311385 /ORGANISM="Pseudokeronopsis sp., Strain OXSARD2" /LENGTH=101 /DNA_ID=CAMNT_0010856903 /DNA_START=762 /DNA_END=1067 /DNA_ORIENTATION=+